MDSSSGKSTFSRLAICSGLHAVHPPPVVATWPVPRPFHGTCPVPAPGVPSASSTGADEPVLHVVPQPVVDDELGRLRAAARLLRLPLRHRGPVHQLARRGSRRCGAAPARSSTGHDRAGGRSPAPRAPAPSAARSPPAQRTTGTGPRPARSADVAHPATRGGTTAPRPAPTRPPTAAASSVAGPVSDPDPRTPARHLSRRCTGGRPGDRIDGRPVQPHRPTCRSSHLDTSTIEVLRRPVESALRPAVGDVPQPNPADAPSRCRVQTACSRASRTSSVGIDGSRTASR